MKKQILLVLLLVLFSGAAFAQGNAFSFQGKLNDGANPANGSYDLQFKLFDAVAGGTQIGPTVLRPATTLIGGVFSTTLDFGAVAFQNPSATFIEIALKPNGSPNTLTILGPRQQLTVVPYASRAQNSTNADNSQNSAQLGGIAAGQYITQTNGDPFYIRNTTTEQANSNFNISGNGVVAGVLGVGSSPSANTKLEVFGDAKITSTSPRLIFRKPLTGVPNPEIIGETGFSFRTSDATRMSILSDGRVRIGNPLAALSPSLLQIIGTADVNILHVTGGSDLAENFETDATEIKPGMVVAIGEGGKLTLARGAYNRRVAGIVSGANNLSAGMILPDLKGKETSLPIALSGRVWVYADATKEAIKPGDLLTTSEMAGYAMKATKYKRAQGAIIGKAMTELGKGTGLVLVLVTLQ